MKTTKIITLVSFVTIVLFSVNSYSQGGRTAKGKQNRGTFKTFDLDGDGQITASEFEKVRAQRQAQNSKNGGVMRNRANAPSFESIDLNNDSVISTSEFAKNQANRFNNRSNSKNGQGMRGMKGSQGMGATQGKVQNRASFDTFDLDGNGQITASEFKKVRVKRQSENAKNGGMMKNSSSAPSFEGIDLNKDGVILPSEFAKNQANRFKNK